MSSLCKKFFEMEIWSLNMLKTNKLEVAVQIFYPNHFPSARAVLTLVHYGTPCLLIHAFLKSYVAM